MFVKSSLIALVVATSLPLAYAREIIVERDGRAFYPRRFGQEQCGGLPGRIGSACRGEVCGVLGGRSIGTLLAASPECAQQDLADEIINASKNEDAATAANMVALAIEFRQCEKNTPPDFTTNPPSLRNSVFCQKAPENAELNGLVQAQDPANDPELFFDPALKATVLRGSQANTAPFGGEVQAEDPEEEEEEPATTEEAATETEAETETATDEVAAPTDTCPPVQTVTVTAGAPAATETAAVPEEEEEQDNDVEVINDNSGALDFGSCTDPSVEFGPAFEGRKLREFTFQPANKAEFAQGSALNGQIVLRAICNILNGQCDAPQETVDACNDAVIAVENVSGGEKADQFNLALGIITNFAEVPAAPGGGPGDASLVGTSDFNLCTTPEIEFGVGFDGRTEASFRPVGADFSRGSALNPAIITRFVCDQLVNRCDANQQAIDDCADAIEATAGLAGQELVDAFNETVAANLP